VFMVIAIVGSIGVPSHLLSWALLVFLVMLSLFMLLFMWQDHGS